MGREDWRGLAGPDAAHLPARKSLWPVRARSVPAHRFRQKVSRMTHPRSSKTSGKGRSRLVLGWVGSGAMKIAPKICYGKYEEQYQYVTHNLHHCHLRPNRQFGGLNPACGRRRATRVIEYTITRIADSAETTFPTRETLLRNWLILQQCFAC
jgi:hypothetical protein